LIDFQKKYPCGTVIGCKVQKRDSEIAPAELNRSIDAFAVQERAK
jgi:hypothetical protein